MNIKKNYRILRLGFLQLSDALEISSNLRFEEEIIIGSVDNSQSPEFETGWEYFFRIMARNRNSRSDPVSDLTTSLGSTSSKQRWLGPVKEVLENFNAVQEELSISREPLMFARRPREGRFVSAIQNLRLFF